MVRSIGVIEKGVTWPHSGERKGSAPAGSGLPPWSTLKSSASGCQRLGSLMVGLPGSTTTSGSFTGW